MLPNLEGSSHPVVFAKGGTVFTNSRDVAAAFEKQHKDVLRAIENLNCSAEFTERNFAPSEYVDPTGRKLRSVDMTRDGFAFVALGFTGAKAGAFKERYIEAFNRMEAELRAKPVDPMLVLNDPVAMRGLLLTYAEKTLAMQGEIEEMRPKTQALDRIAQSDGTFCITDAAKTLQVQPKTLFTFLRSNGWIYSRGGGAEVAYQDKLVQGLLEHKTTTVARTDGSEKTVTQIRVTTKGLARLARECPPVARLI